MLKLGRSVLHNLPKIEPITVREKDEVLNFMRLHFVKDEPLSKSLNLYKSESDKTVGFDNYFSYLIENGDVYKIEDSKKIIAIGMFSLKQKQSANKGLPKVDLKDDPAYQKICDLVDYIENKADIFNRFNIEKYYYIDCIGVNNEYRKLGLFPLLLQESEKRAKSLGCSYLTSLTTGAFSKKGCAKYGMKEVVSVNYKDYKVNGEVVFNTSSPHLEAVYCARYIRNEI